MSNERLTEIRDHQQWYPNIDVRDLLAEVERVTTAAIYLQGPEECLERECEEYFDDNGHERPGVEYCSHLKAKSLSVDEHLAVLAERDRLAEQVQQLRDLTQDEDGNVLPPESELPVGVFYGVLYGAEERR